MPEYNVTVVYLNFVVVGFHVPVIISFPHFYMAEDQYVHGVIGMHPTSDLAIEVAIEPVSTENNKKAFHSKANHPLANRQGSRGEQV